MNVDRLRAVQAEEREADSLRPLPDAFYREVADYLEELRADRAEAAEAADDPFGDEAVRRLTDEIETAEEVAEAIYERRVGKLVKRASLAAAGMSVDEEGLTTEEAELFADLVSEIEAHREDVVATFGGRGGAARGATSPAEPSSMEDPPADGPDPDPAAGDDEDGAPTTDGRADPPTAPSRDGEPEPADEDAADSSRDDEPPETTDGGDGERVTLRITRDVGEVFGVDERVYDLAAEDVVTLPAPNARPLLERDAAQRID